ncbi:MAG: hypothetical protein K2X53_00755 [Alphaproteobacteria bacterium]|nr:hypothetical protein [Alphaproteobacteria bacterium]
MRFNTFDVPIAKLLRGGENGIRAAKYADITKDFLRPSTPVTKGPHVKLLELYDTIGDKIFDKEIFEETPYYQNAHVCMTLTGSYFYDRPENIKTLAERFIAQHTGQTLNLPKQPGQSDPHRPIWVRPIRASTCFEVIDGNHRIARALMKGHTSIPAFIYDKEPVYTPLQQLLLDSLWINKQKWLYQPVDSPELKDEWLLVRQSTDRLRMMTEFLKKNSLMENTHPKTYLDIASSYGWFVKEFSTIGFNAFGMERDPAGIEVGLYAYGVKPEQIIHSDIVIGLENLVHDKKSYDVVSLLSILHHFALNKSSTSAEELMRCVDKITGKVLFFDTGEEHESAFGGTLAGWTPEFIQKWIVQNTTFSKVVALGVDGDKKKPFEGYYNRTLFACVR